MKLTTPVNQLTSVGATIAKRLSYLNIETVENLLQHYPFRYDDYSTTKQIKDLVAGEEVTVLVRVSLIQAKRSPRKRMLITEAVVEDSSGQMKVVWFRQPYIAKQLSSGDQVYLSGKVTDSMFGMEMKNPSFEKDKEGSDTTHTARIVPVYPTTAGITQKQLRYFVSQVIDVCDAVEDWVPESFLDTADVISLPEAIRGIHFPATTEHLQAALRRMKFDELLLHQLRAEKVRQNVAGSKAPVVPFDETQAKQFVGALPFELTKDQKVATWHIFQDLEKDIPMNRLLEGDVGSGKTVVAGMVADMVVHAGKQVAIMAPTSILAEQHFASFCDLFPTDTVVALKTGDTVRLHNHNFKETSKAGKKRECLALLAAGTIDIAIGTHALITKDVFFKNLALAIVDEQHRFGVSQRRLLKEQSGDGDITPHFLSMTATPIPRSYALALYGELDVSIIKTMPKGRKPVNTKCIQESERTAAYDFIRAQVAEGRQAFVICPMIDTEGNEVGEKKTVLAEYEKLSQLIYPNLRVTYVHGKMQAAEKEDTMQAFAAGEFDILVSTSVIEVGVNIPNASVMIIENAERFGLAQLHQFRGRVGRSSHQSYCFLFTDSRNQSVIERLDFFSEHTDGFAVAEYDLKLRGPGEVYGQAQSGSMQFRFASLSDTDLIALAQQCVRGIDISIHPELVKKVETWETQLHLE